MSPEAYAASLRLSVVGAADEEQLATARPWLWGVARRVPVTVPINLTCDLGLLALEGPRALALEALDVPDELGSVVLTYAEHVVGRLRGAPALRSVVDAIASSEDRSAAVVALTGRVADRLSATGNLPAASTAGELRRLLERPETELLELARSALSRAEVRAELGATLDRWIRAARRQPRLIVEADAFVLRHLSALRTPSEQLAFAQMLDAASALSAAVPRRMRARQNRRGTTPTEVHQDTTYPIGGYSALATQGPIENLVSSELVYLEPQEDLDLFDLRYVTGELLRYARDDGVYHRPARRIALVIDGSLLDLRVKTRSLPFQVAVMAQGAALVLVTRLVEWLRTEALELRVLLVDPQGHHQHALEHLRLALSDPLAAGVVQLESLAAPPRAADESDTAYLSAEQGPSEGIGLRVGPGGNCSVFGLAESTAPGGDLSGWAKRLTELLGALL